MNNTQKNSKMLSDQVIKLTTKLDHLEAKYKRLRCEVKKLGNRDGTCWCLVGGILHPDKAVLHITQCDAVYLALYGAERGE